MSKFLPTDGFKWINPTKFDLNKDSSSCSKDCVLEVDLDCPTELFDFHQHFPLALDKLDIKKEILSDYKLRIDNKYNIICFIMKTYNFVLGYN